METNRYDVAASLAAGAASLALTGCTPVGLVGATLNTSMVFTTAMEGHKLEKQGSYLVRNPWGFVAVGGLLGRGALSLLGIPVSLQGVVILTGISALGVAAANIRNQPYGNAFYGSILLASAVLTAMVAYPALGFVIPIGSTISMFTKMQMASIVVSALSAAAFWVLSHPATSSNAESELSDALQSLENHFQILLQKYDDSVQRAKEWSSNTTIVSVSINHQNLKEIVKEHPEFADRMQESVEKHFQSLLRKYNRAVQNAGPLSSNTAQVAVSMNYGHLEEFVKEHPEFADRMPKREGEGVASVSKPASETVQVTKEEKDKFDALLNSYNLQVSVVMSFPGAVQERIDQTYQKLEQFAEAHPAFKKQVPAKFDVKAYHAAKQASKENAS